jgi:photosystem II stability/assembly factor-like uncharacterized protein
MHAAVSRAPFTAFALFALTLCSLQSSAAARPRPGAPSNESERMQAWERHQRLSEDSIFRALPWRSIGPIAQGGRLVDLEVASSDPYTFYAAYASGGLWRTTNNGLSFEPIFDHQATTVIGDIALDPTHAGRIWVGTGENNSSRSSYGGLGVFRSDDDGGSWQHVGLADTDRIGRIHVDPRDGNRVVVAALGRLYTDSGDRGIFVTTDGGESWTKVLDAGHGVGFVDLVADPSDPDLLYAAAWQRVRRPWEFIEGGSGSAIYKSTDAGDSWERLEGGFPSGEHVGRIGLAVAASQPRTLYAYLDNQKVLPQSHWDLGDGAVTAKRLRTMSREEFLAQDPEEIESFVRGNDFHPDISGESLVEMVRNEEITLEEIVRSLEDANANLFNTDISGAQVWRSDDSGATWRRAHEEPILKVVYTYGYYFGQISVSKSDPDQLWIMGVPILRSDDGGAHFRGIDDRVVHGDYQAMHVDGRDSRHIMVGNDGGLAMSWDSGDTWIELNSVPVGQFYTIEYDMAEPYNVYGGLQDNGSWRGSHLADPTDADAWTFLNGGDGFYVDVDERDNKTTYAGYQFGYYTRIDPDGSRHRVRPRNQLDEPSLRYNWMTPVLLSTHNEDIVYFGANRLFRSMNQGDDWTAISDDLTRSTKRGDVPFGTITTVDESHETFGLIWVGTDDGQLWLTVDGGVEWEDVADDLPRDRWVSRVVASLHHRERAYLSLNGYRNDDMRAYVYVTEDLGRHWKSIAKGLPAEPVNVIREDPEREDLLYVGTDRGAYATLDRGETWIALSGGLPSVPVHDLKVHPRDHDLIAGTHGRSVWVLDVGALEVLDEEVLASPMHLFELEEVQASRTWKRRRSQWYHRPDEDDPSFAFNLWNSEARNARLRVLDADDRALREVELSLQRGLQEVEWDLLLDEELALAAESARLETARASASAEGDEFETTLADQPWSEAVRLARPLFVTAGDYTLELIADADTVRSILTVKAPPERPARHGGPLTKPQLHP